MTAFEVRGGTAVLPDGVLDNARIVVEDGRIIDVSATGDKRPSANDRYDADGCWVLPGAIDLHNDGLEKQIRPRPQSTMPLAYALTAYDRLLPTAGITTSFHAVKFSEDPTRERTFEHSAEMATSIRGLRQSGTALIDHHVLHRLDVRSSGAWKAALPHLLEAEIPYVSVDDNQPEQGQFRDLERYQEMLAERLRTVNMSMEKYLALRADDDVARDIIATNIEGLREALRRWPIRVASHDDDTAERVRERHELGCHIAEFPVTEEAAREALTLRMPTVGGAPNALRGQSLYGNLSMRDGIAGGLIDALCSDYYPWSIWWTVFDLARVRVLPLPDLVRLVTEGPARAVGLDADRGRLAVGLRADLVMVRLDNDIPRIEATFADGRLICNAAPERLGAIERLRA